MTMPAWVVPYVAGTLALTAFGHRHALRRSLLRAPGLRAVALAWTDLLGSLCLAPAGLAYWGVDVVGLAGRGPLAVLLAAGCALVLAYVVVTALRIGRDPLLSARRRWLVGGLAVAAALAGNGLDAWWGAQALARMP